MNTLFIYSQSYPYGKACTNRVHYYAKGLTQLGEKVKILIDRPTEYDSVLGNSCARGIYEGVEYSYSSGTVSRSKSFVLRRFYDAKGLLLTALYILRNRSEIEVTLLISSFLSHILLYRLVTWFAGVKLVKEQSEIPFLYTKNNYFYSIYKSIYVNTIYKLFDGLILISKNLETYFLTKVRSNCQLILIPIITDTEEIIPHYSKENDDLFKIVYAGTMCERKDGVLTLIKAFNKVLLNKENCSLTLIGNSSFPQNIQLVKSLIVELSLQSKIILTGYIERDKYVYQLSRADLLVLAKPQSIEADYCFPSKLAEYLMTGKPVITTKTGVIPDYIKDGYNGYLSKANDISDLTEKILYIIDNYETAKAVGNRGRETAIEHFDYKNNALLLQKYIYSLQNNRVSKSVLNKYVNKIVRENEYN